MPKRAYEVQHYRDAEGLYRVRIVSAWNKKIIWATSQGYKRRQSASAAWNHLRKMFLLGDYVTRIDGE